MLNTREIELLVMSNAPTTVEAQLAAINVKLDLLLASRDDQESRIRIQEVHAHPEVTDHEARMRSLERFKWLILGGASVAGGGAGALVSSLLGG